MSSTSHSPSPTRSSSRGRMPTTLADKISAIGAKIAHTLNITPEHEGSGGGGTSPGAVSPGRGQGYTRWGAQRDSSAGPGSTISENYLERDIADDEGTLNGKERSPSRGREAFQSSGRGGLGNIRRTSESRDARPDSGPDDFSTTRGREPRADHTASATQLFSTGRGGAGNIRSPSRDVGSGTRGRDNVEEEIIKSHLVSERVAMHSTGRGGIGNITGSRSQSRARDSSVTRAGSGTHTPLHSTGRGGAGNIFLSSSSNVVPEEQGHSTARGGTNFLASVEHVFHQHLQHRHTPAAGGGEKETLSVAAAATSTATGRAENKVHG